MRLAHVGLARVRRPAVTLGNPWMGACHVSPDLLVGVPRACELCGGDIGGADAGGFVRL